MSHSPSPSFAFLSRVAVGLAIWLTAGVVVLPSPFDFPWAQLLLILAPLVIVPLGIWLVDLDGRQTGASRLLDLAQLPAAACFSYAFLLPQGPIAGALALPWLAWSGFLALRGVARLREAHAKIGEVCICAAFVFLPVGAGWAMLDRFGVRPLDFEPVIVLLTAIHFHYAGFALPLLVGLAARRIPGRLASVAGIGVLAGVPLVAVGITASQLGAGAWLECGTAWLLAGAGLLAGCLQLRLAWYESNCAAARWLWVVSGSSLLLSMPLAALYAARSFVALSWLDIPWMRAVHGTLSASGFALCGLVAWLVVNPYPEPRDSKTRSAA